MIRVRAHSLLSSRVLNYSFNLANTHFYYLENIFTINLMGCNIPYAEVSISEVGAQLENVKYQLHWGSQG